MSTVLRIPAIQLAGSVVACDVNLDSFRCTSCSARTVQHLRPVDPDGDEADSYYNPETRELGDTIGEEEDDSDVDEDEDEDALDSDSDDEDFSAEAIDDSDPEADARAEHFDADNAGDYLEDSVADLVDWDASIREWEQENNAEAEDFEGEVPDDGEDTEVPESVTLYRGQPSQRETLANLAQLYIHDFTEFLRPARLDVDEAGRFADEMTLEDFWTKPDHAVWFIRAGEKIAGFALLNRKAHSGKPADYNMAQFFVMRPYRGLDVAGRAVEQILNAHPGQWEVAIMEQNTPALRFWPKAVARARISQFEAQEHVGESPARTLLRFAVS